MILLLTCCISEDRGMQCVKFLRKVDPLGHDGIILTGSQQRLRSLNGISMLNGTCLHNVIQLHLPLSALSAALARRTKAPMTEGVTSMDTDSILEARRMPTGGVSIME